MFDAKDSMYVYKTQMIRYLYTRSESYIDIEGEVVQQNVNSLQNMNISHVGVFRTRDPVAQVAAGLLSSDETHTHDMLMDTGELQDSSTGGGNLEMLPP